MPLGIAEYYMEEYNREITESDKDYYDNKISYTEEELTMSATKEDILKLSNRLDNLEDIMDEYFSKLMSRI